MSAIAAVVGVFMLIFALVFFSHAHAPPGPIVAFIVFWVVALIGIIIYHIVNATRPRGVPTEIIEGEDENLDSKPSAERLQELADLRDRKLISDAEYQTKRQDILKKI